MTWRFKAVYGSGDGTSPEGQPVRQGLVLRHQETELEDGEVKIEGVDEPGDSGSPSDCAP